MTDMHEGLGPLRRTLLVRTIAIACVLLSTGIGCAWLIGIPSSLLGEIVWKDPMGNLDLLLSLLYVATTLGARGAMLAFPCALPLLFATDLRKAAPLVALGALLGSLAGEQLAPLGEGEVWLYAPGYAGALLGWSVGALRWRGRYFEDPRDPGKLEWLSRFLRRRPRAAPSRLT